MKELPAMMQPLFHLSAVMIFLLSLLPLPAHSLEIEPFRTNNRSPLVQIFGLPAETSATLVAAGRWQGSLTQDIANSYSVSNTATEQILLDGELYRWTLAARYGITDNFELGLELPFVLQGGGFLDGFIIDWHSFWGLPQGGRDTAPKNRLNYRYTKNGVQQLAMNHSSGGVGDISLLAGYKLFEQQTGTDHDSLVIRTQLKLPTGDSSRLLGSGSVDLALFLSGSMNRSTEWGTLGIFGSAGAMFASDGDILKDQRENLAGFGAAGLGWSPADWISFKLQCNLNTPLYASSSLPELGQVAALLTIGGTLKFPGNYLLDIGVGEDIAVKTAPDVNVHLGLSKRF
jgi:hypothetical protein